MKRMILMSLICLVVSFSQVPAALAEVSKQEAASIAQSQYPGRVIDVKQSEEHYRVKILDDNGGVHIIVIDKQSGTIQAAH